jgi:hypothetical protein|tara:strand:- start:4389 stop:4613 length:225 start_codon:yes stop_codon:yes gene_type:complete
MNNRFDDFDEQSGKVNLRITPQLRKDLKQFSLDTGKPMQSIAEYFLKVCLFAATSTPNLSSGIQLDVTLDIDNI